MRLLLEDASGYYTGSVFSDGSLGRDLDYVLKWIPDKGRSGFIGEYEDKLAKNTIAVKTHGFTGLVLKGDAHGVLLLVSRKSLKDRFEVKLYYQ